MFDIFYIGNKEDKQFKSLKDKFFTAKCVDTFEAASKKSITKFFWCIWSDLLILEDFKFDYVPDDYSQDIPHVFRNTTDWYGIWLYPKKLTSSQKEIEHRFLVSVKQVEIDASCYRVYEKFVVDTYQDYLYAMENSKTEMFWATSKKIDTSSFPFTLVYPYNEIYDRKENHVWLHDICGEQKYDGLFLLSKHKPVTKNEIEYRHLVSRKEHNEVASTHFNYDVYIIDTYEQYEDALRNSKTEMFYGVPSNINILPDYKFDLYYNDRTNEFEYERSSNHSFKNLCNGEELENGIFLFSKKKPVTQKELEHRHLVHKNSHDIIASKHKPYDVVFMSYDEVKADENYDKLLKQVPRAKRVHGVKGIHQAHMAAASLCETEMIWIIDADAQLMDNFNFDLYIDKWDRETVHVWRSKNPINNLVYGYGGVKLLPRELTINMDISKPDMTTSITERFKAVPVISNITAFNVDEFSTWKSAFRECCKLSSKVIDRQKSKETEERLDIWCTVGADKLFGEYALAGAQAGRVYGYKNKDNVEELKKINDFDWLKEQFEKYY